MNIRSQRSRTGYQRRRSSGSIFPLLIILGILGLIIWGIFKGFSTLLSNVQSESLSAEIQIKKGTTEFSLADTDSWTPAYSEQKFFTGDAIRTRDKAQSSLKLSGGNTIFLDSNSELVFTELIQKGKSQNIIDLKLNKGRAWIKTSEDSLNEESKSRFNIATNRILLHIRGTVLDLSVSDTQDTIRLVRGKIDIDVFDKNDPENTQNISMGVGQKLVVSNQTVEKIKKGESKLEIIDSDFFESKWHLQNLEKFYPQEAAQIRRKIEVNVESKKIIEEEKVKSIGEIETPKILKPINQEKIAATAELVQIEGTAPVEAAQIVVNGFTLTKYQPGDRKWSYFAAKKFGTLVPGENTYQVYAITRDGKKSETTSVTIFYESSQQTAQKTVSPPITPPKIAIPETKLQVSSPDFNPPLVTSPIVLAHGETYETSSDVVTIKGTVDPKTNAIKVNGYQLKKFKPGNTEFTYIASSRYGKRSNLIVGKNNYEIMAFGPDGKISSTTVKVIYTPVKVK